MISLAANIYLYAESGVKKQQIAGIQSQLANLLDQSNSLRSENANLKRQLTELQQEPNSKNTPVIVTRLGVTDVDTQLHKSGGPRLYIQGDVLNVGHRTAKNVGLNVTLYQGKTIVANTLLRLGTIEFWSQKSVDANIHYSSGRLTSWTIIPEFS
jgi:hypothetical protein